MTKTIPEINVGVVGHIDHGKTTLLSRLSGKFTDTHSEELKRGITIKLGYASATIFKKGKEFAIKKEKDFEPVRYISFIDAPGHEMLMATMLSGAAIIDAAILVIAANEGIRPQTKEHFMALQAKNLKNIIIVQNKIDLVDAEQAKKNYADIKTFVKGTIAEDAPVIPISAQQGINIDKLLEALVEIDVPERDEKKAPCFLIARSFDVNKPGTTIENLKGGVLGGILKSGVLSVGDTIEIKPGLSAKKANQITYTPLETTILSLHKGNETVKSVTPGASIAIETELDPSLTKTDALTGSLASTKGTLPDITHKLTLKAHLFNQVLGTSSQTAVEPFKTKEPLMLNINTTITVGSIESIKGDTITLNLNIPVVALQNDNVSIARNIDNHWRLIGFGEVVA